MKYEGLKTIESIGFLIEILLFIGVGFYLAKWRMIHAAVLLVLGLGTAFYVGEIIRRKEREYPNANN